MKEGSSLRLKLLRPGVIHVTGSLLKTKNKVSFTRLQCRSLICGTNLIYFPNVTTFVWCGDTLPFNILVTSARIPWTQRKHDMSFKLETIHTSSFEWILHEQEKQQNACYPFATLPFFKVVTFMSWITSQPFHWTLLYYIMFTWVMQINPISSITHTWILALWLGIYFEVDAFQFLYRLLISSFGEYCFH